MTGCIAEEVYYWGVWFGAGV